MGRRILTSKYFWMTIATLVPFFIVWYNAGLIWGVVVLIIVGALIWGIFGVRKRRIRHDDYYDEEPGYFRRRPRRNREYWADSGGDHDIYVHQKRRCPNCGGSGKVDPPPINRVFGIKWRCNKCGGSGWVWD